MSDILQYGIPAIASIFVALIELRAAKERKAVEKERKISEERAKEREREARLAMKMQDANMQLTLVTANAVLGGHNNGNVEQAKKAAQDASAEYAAFLRDIAAKEITT